MRNRAKCRLCNEIIESKHQHDYVSCSCGEIAVDGGNAYHRACFKNKENFICIDDEGNEIIPIYKEKDVPIPDESFQNTTQEQLQPNVSAKPPKKELLAMLDEMIKRIEDLPQEALYAPINHADYVSLLILLSAILRAD